MPATRIYFGNTVEAVLAQARKELGEDAMLVDASASAGEDLQFGAYKLEFHVPHQEQPAPAARPAQELPGALDDPRVPDSRIPLDALHAELKRLSTLVARISTGLGHPGSSPELGAIGAALTAADLPPALILELLDHVERRLRLRNRPEPAPQSLLRQALLTEVEGRLSAAPELGRAGAARRIVALAGPPGAGKSTTLAKLAMREGVAARRPTLVLSADTYRVAATEQLRTYAAILGLPFAAAESPTALLQILEENRSKELILIDTPGFGRNELESARLWAGWLRTSPEVEVQLVLPATTRTADLLDALQWWEPFGPAKLIFSRLDETSAAGGCLAAAMLSGKPVSYLCNGQRIPEDLQPATLPGLLRLLSTSPLALGASA